MLRLLEYIIFILLAYRIIKALMSDHKPERTTQPRERQTMDFTHQQEQPSPPISQSSKFNSAEPIDYEEVK
ncbi:MAG: hypothetical protein JWN78_1768 [Bacteroidota bacterium]|nr:hypothetical protein [Bacteroidota bacterium]